MRRTLFILGLTAVGLVSSCHQQRPTSIPNIQAPDVIAPVANRTGLSVTVYRDPNAGGYAFVRENRTVRVPAGWFVLRAPDTATDLIPETVRFQLVQVNKKFGAQSVGPMLEQRYLYDPLSPENLFKKASGQRVRVAWWAGGRHGHEQVKEGVLRSSDSGRLLQLDSGAVTTLSRGQRLYFSALPKGLVTSPTLQWRAGSALATTAQLRLSYRVQKLSWSADYVVHLSASADSVDVEGWITVRNEGDTSFKDAHLQVVAGTVNQTTVRPPVVELQPLAEDTARRAEAPPPPPHAAEQKLGELHLYTVQHPTTLPARSSKQIRFVRSPHVPVRKLYAETTVPFARHASSYPSRLRAEVDHDEHGNLGVPLPAGEVRVLASSSSGTPVLLGQDTVDHTPAGEPWKLTISRAPEQLTRVRLLDDKKLGVAFNGERVRRRRVSLTIVNRSTQTRLRRVLLKPPSSEHILGVPVGAGVHIDGPREMSLEASLAPGQSLRYVLVIDTALPGPIPVDWGRGPGPRYGLTPAPVSTRAVAIEGGER